MPHKGVDWKDDALCNGIGYQLHFAPERNGTRWRSNAAKVICSMCPVREECLNYALAIESLPGNAGKLYGIWGGLTRKERIRLSMATSPGLEEEGWG